MPARTMDSQNAVVLTCGCWFAPTHEMGDRLVYCPRCGVRSIVSVSEQVIRMFGVRGNSVE